jgi:hypothetical protein
MGQKLATLETRLPTHDTAAFCVLSNQPSPQLMTATGHAILRAIIGGQGDQLVAAADAIERLAALLPTASAEARLTAVLIMMASDHPSPPVTSPPLPSPARPTRIARSNKSARPSRNTKPAHPLMDASGRLLPSLEISGVAVIPQAEARKALVMNCPQMIKLENQKLLARIQEGGSRHVWYRVTEVQKLLNLIDRGGADPELADDDDVTDGGA